ncbi:hypothetical protein GCM10027299_09510 [Larkinella ripae]
MNTPIILEHPAFETRNANQTGDGSEPISKTNGLIEIQERNGVHVVDSRLIAEELGIENRALIQTITKYQDKIESRFGQVAFEMLTVRNSVGAANMQRVAHLTEDQAIYVATLSRNTDQVVEFKGKIVQAFAEARRRLQSLLPTDFKSALKALLEKVEENERIAAENERLKPKAEYTDKVLQSVDDMTTTTIAKELGMSAIALNKVLSERKVQYKIDDHYVLYAKYHDCGYATTRTHQYFDGNGNAHTKHYLVWTEVGRMFIHGLLNNNLSHNQKLLVSA